MVSSSRQQMVGHLLKDIVESSEKPSLVCQQDPKYDRFGFKIEEEGSLEEKAERLRRVAQDNLEESELSLEEVRLMHFISSTQLVKDIQGSILIRKSNRHLPFLHLYILQLGKYPLPEGATFSPLSRPVSSSAVKLKSQIYDN